MPSSKTGGNKQQQQPVPKRDAKANRVDRNVGAALRAIYQDAVEEVIPDEMMDLLNKLG